MSLELTIKAKSLAEEARIIRKAEAFEKKQRNTSAVNSLNVHRTQVVRPEARATHLARAMLNGMPYRYVEHIGSKPVPTARVVPMLVKYGGYSKSAAGRALDDWLQGKEPVQQEAAE